MSSDSSPASVTHDESAQRYAVEVDGQVAGHLDYERDGSTVTITHTIVNPAFGGRGLGGTLVRAALDDIREAGGSVVPACSFAAAYLDRHPADQDLLAP